MISSILITDLTGKCIISRHYRGDVPPSVQEDFKTHLATQDDICLKPVLSINEHHFVLVQHNNLYIVGVTKVNSNCAVIIVFLHNLIKVMQDYFNELEQESIRDNFVIIYELLDEMMDFGYPQHTNSNILKEYIMNESHKLVDQVKPPSAVTQAVNWRMPGIRHKRNEVFLDVIEKLNLLVSTNGTVLQSEILGTLVMRCFLSGMPDLKLGLNDKILFENSNRNTLGRTVEMEDIRFHQCVRLARFENDRTISFIPPDGEFELMNYRLDTKVRPLFYIHAHTNAHRSRIEYSVKLKSNYKKTVTANNVQVEIPVPADGHSPVFKTKFGTVQYAPERDVFVWSLRQIPGKKECTMRAEFQLPTISEENARDHQMPPIRVVFEIPHFTVSGIQVRYLKVTEKSGYEALPWVRYITQNGEYQIRMP